MVSLTTPCTWRSRPRRCYTTSNRFACYISKLYHKSSINRKNVSVPLFLHRFWHFYIPNCSEFWEESNEHIDWMIWDLIRSWAPIFRQAANPQNRVIAVVPNLTVILHLLKILALSVRWTIFWGFQRSNQNWNPSTNKPIIHENMTPNIGIANVTIFGSASAQIAVEDLYRCKNSRTCAY